MSDFKFACPVCGQHIKCDSTQGGATLECPTCFQKVIVPQAPATGESKLILTGTKVSERPVPRVNAGGATVVPAGKNSPLAVLVVWIILIGLIGATAVLVLAVHGKMAQARHSPTGPTNQTSQPGKAAAPVLPPLVAPPANDTNWTLDVGGTILSDAAAAGRVHGGDFICSRATLEGGVLNLRMGDRPSVLGVSIYLHARRSADLAGQWVDIATNFHNAPRVTLRWQDKQQRSMTETFSGGYALRIDFGLLAGNRLTGKLYLSTPDDEKSYVAGTFVAEIRKPRPPQH